MVASFGLFLFYFILYGPLTCDSLILVVKVCNCIWHTYTGGYFRFFYSCRFWYTHM